MQKSTTNNGPQGYSGQYPPGAGYGQYPLGYTAPPPSQQPGYMPPQQPGYVPQPGYMPPQQPGYVPQPGYMPPQQPIYTPPPPQQQPVYTPPPGFAPGYAPPPGPGHRPGPPGHRPPPGFMPPSSTTGPKCRRGHPLNTVTVETLMRNERYSGCQCDGCKRTVAPSEAVYHCSICRFDLCSTCSINASGPSSADDCCPRGHPLNTVTVESLARENPGYRSGALCNICRRRISPSEVVRHCSVCEFDSCSTCTINNMSGPSPAPASSDLKCKNGHPLWDTTAESLLRVEGYSGVVCDRCRRSIAPPETVSHCATCKYDLCSRCRSTQKPLPSSPTTMRCRDNHPLCPVSVDSLMRNEGYSGAVCDRCRRPITPSEVVMHCCACKFDLCSRCAGPMSEPVSHSTSRCSRGHPMYTLTVETLMRNERYSGCQCDGCKRTVGPYEVVSHCPACKYDLCSTCSLGGRPSSTSGDCCPRGHPLNTVTVESLARENPGYSSGALCNICRRRISPSEVVRHCSACQFDSCSLCAINGVPGPSPAPAPAPAPSSSSYLKCRSGHMMNTTTVEMVTKNDGYSRVECGICGRRLNPNETVSHCRYCKYDLCAGCAGGNAPNPVVTPTRKNCPHTKITVTVENLIRDEGYTGVLCDGCGRSIDRSEVVRHCSSCKYDLCSTCAINML